MKCGSKRLTLYVMWDGFEVGRLKLMRGDPFGEFHFDLSDGSVTRSAKLELMLPSPGLFGLPRTKGYTVLLEVDDVVVYEGILAGD
jgi:hypothetical protein